LRRDRNLFGTISVCLREGLLVHYQQRKAKVIAEQEQIASMRAYGLAAEYANCANSQILTGEGRSLAVSRKKVSS
jgi:hypothetical protein